MERCVILKIWIVPALIALLAVSCSSTDIQPTSTLPIPTPAPTATIPPIPATSKPESGQWLEEYLEGVQIEFSDAFDELSSSKWDYTPGMFSIENGVLVMEGEPSWLANLYSRRAAIVEKEGIALRFEFPGEATFSIGLLHGQWEAPDCREFGFTHPRPAYYGVDAWEGRSELLHGTRPIGELGFRSGALYEIMIAVGAGGEMIFVIWDTADPSKQRIYHDTFGEGWAGLDWILWANGDRGTVYLDDYLEFSFSELK